MDVALATALRAHFGFAEFRPGQAEAIGHLLAGRNALVVMPTGSGKSLVYQLAALQLPGVSLVISPLIALMQDQVEALTRRGAPATCIHSMLAPEENARRLRALRAGAYRLVYVAPERLRTSAFQETLSQLTISLLAVDEAHCVSQWGHDFRPDYLQIAPTRAQMGNPLTVALTATATPQVQADITRLLGIPDAAQVITGFNRPNLHFSVLYATDPPAKLRALGKLLAGWKEGAAIVYAGTRRDAEETADFITQSLRVRAECYHAGMEPARRAAAQDDFMAGRLPVVVATNAFGMGIDRADVRLVAHYTLPGTLEAYYQEAGRAGRDGKPARAALIYAPKDRSLQEWFIDSASISARDLHTLYQALRAPGASDVSLTSEEISVATGLQDVSVKVGLAQLESAGALHRLGDAGGRMQLRPAAWDEAAIRDAAGQTQARQRHRRAQLERMIEYAESNACRRRILLDHFGDRAPIEAGPTCCDNCRATRPAPAAPRPAPEADIAPRAAGELGAVERLSLVILDATRRLPWSVGKQKLSQLLHGSTAQEMQLPAYTENIYYGRLAFLRQAEIEDLIEQLIEKDYLKVVGGARPALRLTPQGEAAIKERVGVALRVDRAMGRRLDRALAATGEKPAARPAGDTVEATRELFAAGVAPAEIAARRGLNERTIWGHLAQLIEGGKIALAEVTPAGSIAAVRRAIEEVGDATLLAPIKGRLTEDVSWEVIRCVAADWRRKETRGETGETSLETDEVSREVSSAIPPDAQEALKAAILECAGEFPGVFARSGLAKFLVGSGAEYIARYERHPLYGRFARYTRRQVQPIVDGLLDAGVLSKDEHGRMVATPQSAVDPVQDYLSRPHPRPLDGLWQAGWALSFHSGFVGDAWSRSIVGELAYRFKYQGDMTALPALVEQFAALFRQHPEITDVDAIVPMPPSTARPNEPVRALADALSQLIRRPVWPILVKTRQTLPQKEMHTLAQKRGNVAGAFAVKGDPGGKRLLVLDDLFDSGATMEEACRVLRQAGAKCLMILTLTRTIHSDA